MLEPFVIRCPRGQGVGGRKVVLRFYWLLALFIFSATLNLFGFLSDTWSKEVKSYFKRNEKSHPLSTAYLLGDLRDVCQYNTHIWVVSVKSHTNTPSKKNF